MFTSITKKKLVLSRGVVSFYASIKLFLQMGKRNSAPDYRLRYFTPADATHDHECTIQILYNFNLLSRNTHNKISLTKL